MRKNIRRVLCAVLAATMTLTFVSPVIASAVTLDSESRVDEPGIIKEPEDIQDKEQKTDVPEDNGFKSFKDFLAVQNMLGLDEDKIKMPSEEPPEENAPSAISEAAPAQESDLQSQIDAAAQSNGEVVLDKEYTEDIVINSGTVTLDTASFKITNTAGHTITVKSGAVLKLKGSGTVDNVTNGKAALYIEDGGTATVEGSVTLTRSAEKGTTLSANDNSWYVVENRGNLTFNGGTVTGTGNFSSLIDNYKTLTINNGSFSNKFHVIKNEPEAILNMANGTLTVNGRTASGIFNYGAAVVTNGTIAMGVSASGSNALYGNSGTITVKDGDIQGYIRTKGNDVNLLKIEGGKFSKNPNTSTVKYTGTTSYMSIRKSGVTTFYVGDTITDQKTIDTIASLSSGDLITCYSGDLTIKGLQDGVQVKNESNGTVTVNEQVVGYGSTYTSGEPEVQGTLQEKVNTAIAGDHTLTLDTDYTESITINGDLTLDLGSHTLKNDTQSTKPVITVESGTLTIVGNGTIKTTPTSAMNAYAIHVKGGTVNVDSDSVTITNETSQARILSLVEIEANGTFNLKKGTIGGTLGVVYPAVYAKGNFNMSGGKIEHENYAVISSEADTSHINISGGTVKSTKLTGTENSVILAMNHFTMTGGEVSLDDGVNGKAIMSKTTNSAFDDMEHLEDHVPNADITIGEGAVINGDVVFDGYTQNGTLKITGGTFGGELVISNHIECTISGGLVKKGLNLQTSDKDGCHVKISGGTFNGYYETAEHSNVEITGGIFANVNGDILEDIVEGVACVQESREEDAYFVGPNAEQAFSDAESGDFLTVASGDITVDDVQFGVYVENLGTGTVVVNGINITQGSTVLILDYTVLEEAVKRADDALTGSSSGSVSEEIKEQIRSNEKYTNAKACLDNHTATDISEIERLATELNLYLDEVLKLNEPDWDTLNEELTKAKVKEEDRDMYDNFHALDSAISKAESLLKRQDSATAEEVNSAIAQLRSAMEGLKVRDRVTVDENGVVKIHSTHLAADMTIGLTLNMGLTPALKNANVSFTEDAAFENYFYASGIYKAESNSLRIVFTQLGGHHYLFSEDNQDVVLGTITVKDSQERNIAADISIEKSALSYMKDYSSTSCIIPAETAHINGLEAADLTELKAAIQRATELDEGSYEDFSGVTEALQQAQALLEREDELTSAEQGDIQSATDALTEAIEALTEKKPEGAPDLSTLKEYVHHANELDRSLYTSESLSALDTALQTANDLIGRENQLTEADAQAVEEAEQALKSAEDNLEMKDYFTISENGTLTLHSSHLGNERFASLQLNVTIHPSSDSATVKFTKTDKTLTYDKADYDKESEKLSIYYISEYGNTLMNNSEEEFVIGKLSVTDADSNPVSATITITNEDFTCYNDSSSPIQTKIATFTTEWTGIKETGPANLEELRKQVDAAEQINPELLKDSSGFTSAFQTAKELLGREQELNSDNQDEIDTAAQALKSAIESAEYKDAEWAELEAVIAEAEGLEETDYVDFSNVESALNAARDLVAHKAEKDIRNQEEINSAKETLRQAIDALVEKTPSEPADLERLKELAHQARQVDDDLYTSSSRSKVYDALQEANKLLGREEELTKDDQTEIDAAADKLQSALDDLKLMDWITLGTDGSVTLHSNHMASDNVTTINLVIDVTPAFEGANIAFTFDDAVPGILKEPFYDVNKITLYMSTGGDLYISEDGGELLLGKITVTNDAGKAVAADVNIAEDALSYVYSWAEKTGKIQPVSVHLDGITEEEKAPANVEALREQVNTASNIDPDLLKNGDELKQALDAANKLLERADELTEDDQQDVDDAVDALKAAIAGVEYLDADLGELEAAIQEAEALEREHYSDLSEVDKALKAAKELKERTGLDIRNQDEIDQAAQALRNAVDALTHKGADVSKLQDAVNAADKLDKSLYTDFSDVQSALDTAKELLARDNLTSRDQSAIDSATEQLKSAMDALTYKPADTSKLEKAIEAAKKLESNLYSNFDALDSALKAAETLAKRDGLNITDQEDIDAAAEKLNSAMNALTYKPADTSKLEEAIDAAKKLESSLYTNLDDLDAALKAAEALLNREDLNISNQAEIDAAVSALQKAMDELTHKAVNKDKLREAIRAARRIDRNMYMDLTDLDYALSAAVALEMDTSLDIRDQEKVDKATEALLEAIQNLVLRPADYEDVWNAVEKAEALDRTVYTEDTLAVLDMALDAIETGLDCSHQAEVDRMAKNILDAINSLKFKSADLSALKAAVTEAEQLKKEDYKDFSKVEAALAKAKEMLGKESSLDIRNQTEIDLVCGTLINAMKELTGALADYSKVEAAIRKAETLQRSMYKEDSLKALDAALRAVKYGLEPKDQYLVDAMAVNIENAIANLKYKSADTTYLKELLETAKKLNPLHYKNFSAVARAMQNAEMILASSMDIRNQADIDKAAAELKNAMEKLQAVEVTPKPSTKPSPQLPPNASYVPPAPTKKPSQNNPAQTSDEFPYGVMLALTVAALVGAAGTMFIAKRKED